MRRWFAHRQSSRSAFFSAIFYDLRSLHSGTCLNTKTPRAFCWKRAFSTWISKFASFWLCFEQANWTGSRKKLGYEVNFLSTASGTVEQYTQVSSAALSSLLVQSITRKTSSFDRNSSDGKASLKRKKSPETTTDTQDVSKCYWFYV